MQREFTGIIRCPDNGSELQPEIEKERNDEIFSDLLVSDNFILNIQSIILFRDLST